MTTVGPPHKVPVVIVGGGPVGLTLSALLARYGIMHAVIEADAGYCEGSRAICVSRRSQEILAWAGAATALAGKSLPWTGGRSFWRDQEVLRFQMPHDPSQRFAPMVNIQQFYIEQFAHEAAMAVLGRDPVQWRARLCAVTEKAHGVVATVNHADGGEQQIEAQYLVACDGGRSTVREHKGLKLEGTQYEGRYVIVDIVQATARPVERLAWFDPPSNPGSTILMHRQPDDVWRIDYQIAADVDAAEAIKPENVLPRVQSHLDMIGETAPWRAVWISLYNAKCLTLPQYRYGRTFFAGDAAHLVPIFGVRGLNSGLDDVGNLAWKLASVVRGAANQTLLDSYSDERVHAARENIAYGAKSTEFMAPPSYGFEVMREAALRLATESSDIATLINPRQSTPIEYVGSTLNLTTGDDTHEARPGMPAPEAEVTGVNGSMHLTTLWGERYTLLHFAEASDDVMASNALCRVVTIASGGEPTPHRLIDQTGQAGQRYTAEPGTALLVRPDGYLCARWAQLDEPTLQRALAQLTHR